MKELVLSLARDTGFDIARTTPAVVPSPRSEAFDAWIAAGRHAGLGWLETRRNTRVDVRHIFPEAKTALALAIRHPHRRPPDPGGRTGLVARYAWGRDYHNLVVRRLRKLRRRLAEHGIHSWGGVDAAPILERGWAEAAGVGASGKNSVVFEVGRGPWLLLAVLFVDVDLPADPPVRRDACGSCTRCLTACPTDAFRGPRDLDASRCISYWTIESRDLPPEALRARFGRWVFGCDGCLEVCPHGHDPDDPDLDWLAPKHPYLDLDEVLASTDEALYARFEGCALRRPGPAGLKRNAAIVLGNLGDPDGAKALSDHGLRHRDPTVVEASRWALGRLHAPR